MYANENTVQDKTLVTLTLSANFVTNLLLSNDIISNHSSKNNRDGNVLQTFKSYFTTTHYYGSNRYV